MKPTLRRQIRQWAEANEPTRAVECAVKLWNFSGPPTATRENAGSSVALPQCGNESTKTNKTNNMKIDLTKLEKNDIGLRICKTQYGTTALIIDRKFPCEMCYHGVIGTRPASWNEDGRTYPACDPHPWDIVMPQPWTLGRSVNGFTLSDGQQWHREDFTEDMLPDGWRPHILGELDNPGDVAIYPDGECYVFDKNVTDIPTKSTSIHRRTRRQLPAVEKWAKEKQAFARGETIQFSAEPLRWRDCGKAGELDEPKWAPHCEYRVKPAPVMVPLSAEDVKCGDRLKQPHFNPGVEFEIVAVLTGGIGKFVHDNDAFRVDLILWSELKSDWLISRDGKNWTKCEKPEGGK